MFKKPFSFEGRIRRTEYLVSLLAYLAVYGVVEFLSAFTHGAVFILFLPAIWLMIAQGVKRSHDINNSGWYILIPFYGLWLLFKEGDKGMNQYGEDPKGFVDSNEIYAIGSTEEK
jgi:uncharacterized membrane protein YhaH (DUF805 family)